MKEILLSVVLSVVNTPIDSFSFSVIGDTQARKHLMTKAAKDMADRKVSFVTHVGDVDYCGGDKFWRRSKTIMDLSGLKWYMTIGNHSLYNCYGNKTIYRYTKQHWSRFWWGDNSTFHSFDFGDKKFVFLDSSTYYYPMETINSLESVLESAKDKSVFIFTHKPIAYDKPLKIYYGSNLQFWHPYYTMGGVWYGQQNKSVWHTLKRQSKKVLAIFHGHYHAYRSYTLDGIPVYCSGGGGGTLETSHDFYNYLFVEVKGNKYTVKVVRL